MEPSNHRRPFCHWASIAIATTAIFCAFATTVSGFSSYYSSSLPSQLQYKQQHKQPENLVAALGRRRRRSTRLLATVDKRKYDDDDEKTTAEFNDVLSRRQTLAALTVSTAALFSMPLIASAEDDETVNNNSRAIQTTRTVTDVVRSASSVSIASTKSAILSEPSSFQESLSGFIAGATLAGTKTLVKYPLDTATVRVQMPNSDYSIRDPFALFNGCYNGISLTLISNIPAGAVFFAVKDAVKTGIKNSGGGGGSSTMPSWLSTSLAVAVAQIPYWLLRNPSEVVKVRQQANVEGYGEGVSAIDAIKQTLQSSDDDDDDENNISDFYTGFWENILYAYPADVIKFVAYESITKGRKDLSPAAGAKAGAIATALAQLVTTPLDVVRNRLMTGKNRNGSSLSEEEKNKSYVESLITLGKEEGLSGLFAGATPRAGKAILSGAIQFATYEETKQSISKILLQR